jgi:glycosyltransferase involved in cell wall biosynthesis
LTGAEAMSHGIPLIVSRVGAVADLVEDGVNGLHFEAGNAQDLARKMDLLWRDPELARHLGRAAREKCLSLWSPDRHFRNLNAVYERVLTNRAVGCPKA